MKDQQPGQTAQEQTTTETKKVEIVEVLDTSHAATSASATASRIVGTPPQEQQLAVPQESWWQWLRTKTTFGGLSQLSIATSFIAAPLNAITSGVANNAAVFFALMYFFRKNAEVRSQNKGLEIKIDDLRSYMHTGLNIDTAKISSIPKTEEPTALENLGTFNPRNNPMLYSLATAAAFDLANCGASIAVLLKSATGSCLKSSSSSETSVGSDSLTLGLKIGAATTGALAIGLALPQMWAAHTLRQYQTELTKELSKLEQLRTTELERLVRILKMEAQTKDITIADLRKQLGEAQEKIKALGAFSGHSQASLAGKQWSERSGGALSEATTASSTQASQTATM